MKGIAQDHGFVRPHSGVAAGRGGRGNLPRWKRPKRTICTQRCTEAAPARRLPPSGSCVTTDAKPEKISDRAGLAAGLVGQRHRLEIPDLRVVAVAGADALTPRTVVEGFGIRLRFPHVDPAGDAALLVADELLAEEASGLQEVRRDFGEVRAAFLQPDRRRQVIENNGCDHRRGSPVHRLIDIRRASLSRSSWLVRQGEQHHTALQRHRTASRDPATIHHEGMVPSLTKQEKEMELNLNELDAVSGGDPALGGYTYCNVPGTQEGLYVGGC